METQLNQKIGELTVQPTDPKEVDADVVFSALPSDEALKVEESFASRLRWS